MNTSTTNTSLGAMEESKTETPARVTLRKWNAVALWSYRHDGTSGMWVGSHLTSSLVIHDSQAKRWSVPFVATSLRTDVSCFCSDDVIPPNNPCLSVFGVLTGIDCVLNEDASLESCIVVWGVCSTWNVVVSWGDP